jgi:hypothetical protein
MTVTKTPDDCLPTRRHAIYWTPSADHPLWRAGCEWLGRDAESDELHSIASHRLQPRRYGFHATLKPPFELRKDAEENWLLDAMVGVASEWSAFEMPRLTVATLGDFIALRPADQDAITEAHPLRRLADECVRRLDPLRMAPDAVETRLRMRADLSAGQRANVDRWGYPHVFESWRFHMTLTDSLPGLRGAASRKALMSEAREHFAEALAMPLRCDEIALFVEDAPGADLRLQRRFGFAR